MSQNLRIEEPDDANAPWGEDWWGVEESQLPCRVPPQWFREIRYADGQYIVRDRMHGRRVDTCTKPLMFIQDIPPFPQLGELSFLALVGNAAHRFHLPSYYCREESACAYIQRQSRIPIYSNKLTYQWQVHNLVWIHTSWAWLDWMQAYRRMSSHPDA